MTVKFNIPASEPERGEDPFPSTELTSSEPHRTQARLALIEGRLDRVIVDADAILTRSERECAAALGEEVTAETGARAPGERWQACGLSAAIVAELVTRDPELRALSVTAIPIQNQELHALIAEGAPPELVIDRHKAFRHAATLVVATEGAWLVDLTICQYFDKESGLIMEGSATAGRNFQRMSAASTLLSEGKLRVAGADSALFPYLAITTLHGESNVLRYLRERSETVIPAELAAIPAIDGISHASVQRLIAREKE